MNERISALFCRAGGSVTVTENSVLTYTEHFDPEKFAELIVEECLKELRKEWYELNAETIDDAFADPRATGIHIGQKNGAIKCISRIKEHFGIEE